MESRELHKKGMRPFRELKPGTRKGICSFSLPALSPHVLGYPFLPAPRILGYPFLPAPHILGCLFLPLRTSFIFPNYHSPGC